MSLAIDLFGAAIESRNDVLLGAAIQCMSPAELSNLIAGLEMTADTDEIVGDARGTSITLVVLAAARRLRDHGEDPVDVMRELADRAPGFYDEEVVGDEHQE